MAVKLNQRAFEHARELISAGHVVFDERDSWDAHQPLERDAIAFIAAHGVDAYGRWHLGVEPAFPERMRARYKLPFGDFENVHRCAVLSIEARDIDGIWGAAHFLANLIETVMARDAAAGRARSGPRR